jgi:hypothetical protein
VLDTLISSKTRLKLLMKFFLNGNTTAYLRGLESEFGDSTNGIRVELNRFEAAGMIQSFTEGNKKVYGANKAYPLFREIHSILLKHIGLDQIIINVIQRLGHISHVFVTGDLAVGKDSPVIDLLIVSDEIDKNYLLELVEKAEKLIGRKIRFLLYSEAEYSQLKGSMTKTNYLLLWSDCDCECASNHFMDISGNNTGSAAPPPIRF